MAAFQQVLLDEQLRLQNIEKEKKEFQNKIRTYLLSAGLGVILLVAFLLYRNNRQKHNANIVLQGTERQSGKHFARTQIHPIPTHPIRKNGIAW